MPPHWSLGYHQCRWNYTSSDDIRTVRRLDEDDIPVDVFWLDISWKENGFPDPVEMTNEVGAFGRKVDFTFV